MSTIPLIGTYGIFTVLPPFSISPVNYKCTSLQLLTTLVNNGMPVYARFYAPNGLSQTDYLNDINNNVSLVTLESNEAATLLIPTSYLDDVPVKQAVPYSQLFISIDVGELPDQLGLDQLLLDLKSTTDQTLGVDSTAKLHKIQSTTNYSFEQYTLKEAQRLAIAQNYVSYKTAKLQADAQLAEMRTRIQLLEAALIAANVLLGN